MKKYLQSVLAIIIATFLSINLIACGSDDEPGSIYGIVTELGTAEPMKAVGVELYKSDKLLLKSVTFDDGHFEFTDLTPGDYKVRVVADGYERTEGEVVVEAGRQARIDLQVSKLLPRMVVRTLEATIDGTEVTLSGEYTYESGYAPNDVGIVYSTQSNPKEGGKTIKCKVDNNNRSFTTKLTDLSTGTYYFQAYAKNGIGTVYGEERILKLSISPVITTLAPTNITKSTATLNGQIENEGDPAYIERGFVYSRSYNYPSVDDPENTTTKVVVAGRSQKFSANISSLIENSTYYVRAYATYEDDTVYGEVQSFKATDPEYVIIDNLMIQKTDLGKSNNLSARAMCEASRVGGFTDWHLPTLAELSIIYSYRTQIPNLQKERYWSSTGTNSYESYYSFL